MGLTPKQKAFCEYYASNGNATESAKLSGYSEKTARSIGDENLTKPDIKAYIMELSLPKENKRIADVMEIKEFWSSTMRDNAEKMTDRIKASELIGKTAMMFVDKVETTITTGYSFSINRAKKDD